METLLLLKSYFMEYLLVPISFLVIFLVQLKILRTQRAHTNLILYYGKQSEDLKKMLAGSQQRRVPEASPGEPGLYEVLKE